MKNNDIRSTLFEVLGCKIDEELQNDILEFINCEIAVEVEGLLSYLYSISVEDVLYWLHEYESKWNPSSMIYQIVVNDLMYYIDVEADEICEKYSIILNGATTVSNGGTAYFIVAQHDADLSKGGIYQIRNMRNNRIYVGSAKKFRKRWREHRNGLNGNYHGNDHLQKSWKLNGENKFTFEVIEYIDDYDSLFEREKYWLEKLEVTNKNIGYNIYPYPIGYMAGHYPDETKKK